MKHFEYKPENVCCQKISFDITEDNKINNLKFERGCPGNLSAISKILEGFEATKAIEILKGNTCGPRPTSCADQLSKALEKALSE